LKECLSTSLPTGQIMVKFALYDAGAREDNHRNADSAKNRAKTLVGGTEGGVGVGDGRGRTGQGATMEFRWRRLGRGERWNPNGGAFRRTPDSASWCCSYNRTSWEHSPLPVRLRLQPVSSQGAWQVSYLSMMVAEKTCVTIRIAMFGFL
jgi:hypothetical protein